MTRKAPSNSIFYNFFKLKKIGETPPRNASKRAFPLYVSRFPRLLEMGVVLYRHARYVFPCLYFLKRGNACFPISLRGGEKKINTFDRYFSNILQNKKMTGNIFGRLVTYQIGLNFEINEAWIRKRTRHDTTVTRQKENLKNIRTRHNMETDVSKNIFLYFYSIINFISP